jgi:hypothetical protein
MNLRVSRIAIAVLSLALATAAAQQTGSSAGTPSQTVPPLIQLSNVATDEGGNTLSGVVSITFSLYGSQQGGEPLWSETQNNVQLDSTGHYSVELGITKQNGVPTTLFTNGEARWLGVQIAGQAEQARVLLLSVPYALKAGDAATIGGLPPSAFVLAAAPAGAAAFTSTTPSNTEQNVPPPAGDFTGSGTTDFIPLWTSAANIGNSVLFQSGTGSTAKIGINTTTPATTLDIKGGATMRGTVSVLGTLALPATAAATAAKGANSQPLNLTASAFNTSAAVNQTFRWQAEPAGNDTASPSGTLNLLFGEGTSAPEETGLHIATNGQITFAAGQTFPGTGDGTITGVGAIAGLTGGGSSGDVALGLATNTCSYGNALIGHPFTCSPFATLNANNFTGSQTVNESSATAAITANQRATTGATYGVLASNSSASGVGVFGQALATSGQALGVAGTSNGPAGVGVYGAANATSGNNAGVAGFSNSTSGSGVVGTANATSGTNYGVYGSSGSTGGYGVYGTAPSGAFGVYSAANIGNTGDLREDYTGVNAGSYTPGLRFGSGFTGEGIASDRMGTVNLQGIDFYTDYTARMSIANNGYVGIGTTNPQALLSVVGGGVSIGGDTPMSNNPRMFMSAFFPGVPFFHAGYFGMDKPFTVLRMTASSDGQAFNCSSDFQIIFGNNPGNGVVANQVVTTFPEGSNLMDSGSISVSLSAGTYAFSVSGGTGCSQNIQDVNASVEYVMQ